MSTPTYIRVAGKLYRRADLDVIQETQGRDCGCHGTAVKVKPEEADIALENLYMEGFLTHRCPGTTSQVCAKNPPGQPEAVPTVEPVGGDTITSRLHQNWPSQVLKPYNGSAPKFIRVNGQVYRKAEMPALDAPALMRELSKVYADAQVLVSGAVAPPADKLLALEAAIKALGDAVRNVVAGPGEEFPRSWQ